MNFKKLDKRSPIPLYYQLAEWILEEIGVGSLLPGTQLPSERELGEQMGISRMTVRQAITYLANEGNLVVKPGVGTFVAEPKLMQNALNLRGFTEEMMRQGGTVTSEVLEQVLVHPPQRIAAKLALSPYEKTVKIVRLRYVDQTPLLLETSYVPVALCPDLVHQDLSTKSLYTQLEQTYGFNLQRSSQIIEATVINEYERPLFGVDPHLAMILLEGVTYTKDDLPVEYFKALYRGDRFKFTVESQRHHDLDVTSHLPLVGIVLTSDGTEVS